MAFFAFSKLLKIPWFNNAAVSKKEDKKLDHRSLRRKIKEFLSRGEFDILPLLREIRSIWAWGCDGRKYNSDAEEKDMRK